MRSANSEKPPYKKNNSLSLPQYSDKNILNQYFLYKLKKENEDTEQKVDPIKFFDLQMEKLDDVNYFFQTSFLGLKENLTEQEIFEENKKNEDLFRLLPIFVQDETDELLDCFNKFCDITGRKYDEENFWRYFAWWCGQEEILNNYDFFCKITGLEGKDKDKFFCFLLDKLEKHEKNTQRIKFPEFEDTIELSDFNNIYPKDTRIVLNELFILDCKKENFRKVLKKLNINYISRNLSNDVTKIIKALSQGEVLLEELSENFRDNEIVVHAALEFDESQFEHASLRLKEDKDFVLKILNYTKSTLFLEHISKQLTGDKDIFSIAVKMNGLSIQYSDLINDQEIVISALEQDPEAYKHICGGKLWKSSRFKEVKAEVENFVEFSKLDDDELWCFENQKYLASQNRNDTIELIKKGKIKHLDLLAEEYRNDIEIVLSLVKYEGLNLKFASKSLQENCEVVLAAVCSDGRALEYSLISNREIALAALKNTSSAIEYVDVSLVEKIVRFYNKDTSEARFLFIDSDSQEYKTLKNNSSWTLYRYDNKSLEWADVTRLVSTVSCKASFYKGFEVKAVNQPHDDKKLTKMPNF